MGDILIASGSSALVVSVLMQTLKNSSMFPWLNRHTGKLNFWVSVLLAGVTAIGVSYSFDFDQETGAFAFGFKGTLHDVLHGVAHWIGQWSAQHSIYKGLLAPPEILGEIRAMLIEEGRVAPKPGGITPTKLD